MGNSSHTLYLISPVRATLRRQHDENVTVKNKRHNVAFYGCFIKRIWTMWTAAHSHLFFLKRNTWALGHHFRMSNEQTLCYVYVTFLHCTRAPFILLAFFFLFSRKKTSCHRLQYNQMYTSFIFKKHARDVIAKRNLLNVTELKLCNKLYLGKKKNPLHRIQTERSCMNMIRQKTQHPVLKSWIFKKKVHATITCSAHH